MFIRSRHFIDLFVVQPTTFCNIDCKYCYLPDRAVKKRLSPEVLQTALKQLKSDRLIGSSFTLVWHAGEPLATGLTHFRELAETVDDCPRRENINIQHSIQTNGILINQEWCDFFKKYDVRVGVSVDGPQFIHDANRLTRNGKGTFDLVMKGIGFLRKNDIPYHAIAVVTEQSPAYPEELFTFFQQNGFYNLGLNIEEIEGITSSSSLQDDDLLEDKFHRFWKRIFDLYKDSDQKMKIREFDHLLRSIFRFPKVKDIRKLEPNSHQVAPFAIITMDTDGNFSTFSPELLGQVSPEFNNFVFENIKDGGFMKAPNKSIFKAAKRDIKQGVKKGRDPCQYFYLCGGGAPSNK